MHAVSLRLYAVVSERGIGLDQRMLAEYSYRLVKAELVLGQLREPLWAILLALLQKLEPHVLVVQVRPQLEELECKYALLLDVIERDVSRRIQRPVFVREQLWRLLLQPKPGRVVQHKIVGKARRHLVQVGAGCSNSERQPVQFPDQHAIIVILMQHW
jgi:hypothetical protein